LSFAGVSFQTVLGGQFVGAQNNGGGAVIATATVAQAWEKFTLIDINGGSLESGDPVFIQTGNGQFFQALNGGGTTLNAGSNNKLGWETFKIVKKAGSGTVNSGDVIGLQASSSAWVSAANGGGGTVYAYGGALGDWESLIVSVPATSSSNDGSGGSAGGTGGATAEQPGAGSGGLPSGSPDAGAGQPAGPQIQLPIEVLGSGAPDAPAIAGMSLTLAGDVGAVQFLYVQCHRCGFYDSPEFEALAKPLVKAKASLRIVGGGDVTNNNAPWIDITNSTVQVDPVALAHGGINGGQVALTFTLPIDGATRARLVAAPETNRIEFRFNGTDGNSNGYRVLDVQLQDGAGKNLTPATKIWADIWQEKVAGKAPSSGSAQGQSLWTGRNLLIKSPIVARKIRAACNDCHATDGRDLQYFNYSNNSIVQRSMFHGLTAAQGQWIAAYLRTSLYSKVPHVAAAAPWNPPFQPGPGLDSKPAVEWSAGAGLAAVLPDGKTFMKAFFGQPVDNTPVSVTQADINRVLDATKVLNTREVPIALQYPDWDAWLPPVHPLDLWPPDAGQSMGLFETGSRNGNPYSAYHSIESWLDRNKNPNGVYGDWSTLTPQQRNDFQWQLQAFGAQTTGFGGGGRGTRVSGDPNNPWGGQIAAQKMLASLSSATAGQADLNTCGPVGGCTPFSTEAFIERADVGLYHWMAVKQWEIVEVYGLQNQQSFHGSVTSSGQWAGDGEVRGWPFSWPSVFYVAPHMIYAPQSTPNGLREFYFSWENRRVSYYRTNAWYQLQLSVNPGWGGASNGAIDWPYTQGFITGLVDELNGARAPGWISAAHLARYFLVNAKLAQKANTNLPFNAPDPNNPGNIWNNGGLQSKADLLFKLSPATILDQGFNQPNRFRALEQIAPGSYLTFVNGSIALYNSLYANTTRGQYRICDPNNTQMGIAEQFAGQRFCIDAGRTPLPVDGQGRPYCWFPSNDGFTTEQQSVWGVMESTRIGADPGLVKTWSDWIDRMWPN
jgi:hypothetical protein